MGHLCAVAVVGDSVRAALHVGDLSSGSELSDSVGDGSWAGETLKSLEVQDKTNDVWCSHRGSRNGVCGSC